VSMGCGDIAENTEVPVSLQIVGTSMVISASFISTFGVNLQKWAHNKNADLPFNQRVSMVKNWRWWLGMIGMILASVFDLVALPWVPQSRVAALGAVTMVSNVIVTPLFLGEKLTRYDIVGCIVIVGGCVLTTIFGAGNEPDIDSTCLLDYFKKLPFLIYAFILLVGLVILYYFIRGYKLLERAVVAQMHADQSEEEDLQVDFSFECVWAHENQHLIEPHIHKIKPYVYVTRFGPQFYPFIHAAFGGMCGANSIMFAKAVLIFLSNLVAGKDSAASGGYLVVFLVPFVLCLFLQIKYLNAALKIYQDALFVLPCYQSFWIVFGIAAGLIFYQEYTQLDTLDVILFTVGVAVSLLGVVILAMRNAEAPLKALEGLKGDEFVEYNLANPEFLPHHYVSYVEGEQLTFEGQPLMERPSFDSLYPPDHMGRSRNNSHNSSRGNSPRSGMATRGRTGSREKKKTPLLSADELVTEDNPATINLPSVPSTARD